MYKLCRHVRISGERCRSGALNNQHFCHYHLAQRQSAETKAAPNSKAPLELPSIDDRFSVQIAISRVLTALASGAIDPRQAGLFLYGIQIAASNLPRETSVLSPFKPVRRIVLTPQNEQLAEAATIYEDHDTKGHKRGCQCNACQEIQLDMPHHSDCSCGECHYFAVTQPEPEALSAPVPATLPDIQAVSEAPPIDIKAWTRNSCMLRNTGAFHVHSNSRAGGRARSKRIVARLQAGRGL